MKIRMDFVTNSSSSSYIVTVGVTTVDGKNYSVVIDPSDRYICGGGEAHIFVDVLDEVIKATSISELCNILTKSIRLDDYAECFYDEGPTSPYIYDLAEASKDWESEEDYEDEEDDDYEDEHYFLKESVAMLDDFKNEVINKVEDISKVSEVSITSEHSAWGEFMSEDEVYLLAHSFVPSKNDSENLEVESETATLDMKTKKISYSCNPKDLKQIKLDISNRNSESDYFSFDTISNIEFDDKIFVLTGFEGSEESKITEIIESKGGVVKSSTVVKTNYLVVMEDYDHKTQKYNRAIELKEKGNQLYIIGSKTFYELSK